MRSGGATLELALDLRGDATLLAGGVDPEPVLGRGVVAANNFILCAAAGVIVLKGPPQPPRFNPHDRIGLRVEILPPSERLDGNRVALDASPLAN